MVSVPEVSKEFRGGTHVDSTGQIGLVKIISEGAVYLAGKKRWVKDRFHVFERAVSFGKELEPGVVADRNYIWFSDWQLENINNNYLIPVDLETYRQLRNHIAKTLVPLLQNDPDLAGVIPFHRKRWKNPIYWLEALESIQTMRSMHFDCAIDLQGLARSAIAGWLANADVFYGLDDDYRKILLLHYPSGRKAEYII